MVTYNSFMNDIFHAIADKNRRLLLDELSKKDGQTLGELCEHLPNMTRYGVMKHIKVLENSNIISAIKVGREKYHYLNVVPIRQIYERWVNKFADAWAKPLTNLKYNLENKMNKPNHVYEVYINAPIEKVWEALTDGEVTPHYYFGFKIESDYKVGSDYKYVNNEGNVTIAGEILEIEEPNKLVMTFKGSWIDEIKNDPATKVTYELTNMGATTKLKLIHDDFDGETATYKNVQSGWSMILSSFKSLLETGKALEYPRM